MLLALPGGALQPAREPAGPAGGHLTGPQSGDPVDLAKAFLRSEPGRLGVSAADVAELEVLSASESARSGVTHVHINQHHQDRMIFGAVATVNVAKNGAIISARGLLIRDVAKASGTLKADPVDAVEAAAEGLDLGEPQGLEVLMTTSETGDILVSEGGISDEPIPARLGWQPTDDGLRLAWEVVIDDASDVSLWNAAVDAETGELLNVEDWTIEHGHEDLEHLSRGGSGEGAATTASTGRSTHQPLQPFDDGSTYRVLEIPKESPNDGPLTDVTNPADARFSPLGWHDTGAQQFTTTRGNNVHAYLDQDANNIPDFGQDVDGGTNLQFLFDADLREHAQAYREAAVTNLFYWNNVIHDVLYNYGFDEESGNFQQNKFGRANGTTVLEGDYVRAEAADGGGTNNANFSTPARGGTPRMQMYLWPGNQFGAQNLVTVGGTSFNAGWARFGPPASVAGTTGQLFVAGNNGCTAADYAGMPADAIAITVNVTSGTGSCTNPVRTGTAEAAGAAAVIIASTSGTGTGAGPILTGAQTAPPSPVGIPAVSVTLTNGNSLRDLAGESATVAKNPAHRAIRDGDLENGIIIHEYGHGVSFRLTGGPGVNCLSGNEQMGEGWSDYLAIAMLMDPELDDPEAPRGMGPYALFQDTREGNGIRVTPYSRNMTINPVTYDNIMTGGWRNGSIAVPHGIGWVWASILWDMTWDLVDRHGFADNIYGAWDDGGNTRALQYVMDGMKFQGCFPGFLDGRDGILEAAEALGGDDTCMIWSAFARRGFGASAVQGTTNRNDNTEAFDVPAACKAPGQGFVGPQFTNAPELNTRTAGDVAPIFFNVAGHPKNGSLDALKDNHSPSSQRIDCTTLEPFGGQQVPEENITTPTDGPGNTQLMYNRQQNRYHYNWQTSADWAGTCRQLIITLEDGTQHRANFRFTAP